MAAKLGEATRTSEIVYLQDQNRLVLNKLEDTEQEREEAQDLIKQCREKDAELNAQLQSVKDKIQILVERLNTDKKETASKDAFVKLLAEQNKQMLSMLDQAEKTANERKESCRDIESKNRKLEKIAEAFDAAKAQIEKEVAEAKAKCADVVVKVKDQRGLNETLRANIQNTEARTRVDIEALAQALQVVDHKNLEYLSRINRQETKEQQLKGETSTLQEEVENVRADIDSIRKQLEGDQEGRTNFERARGQLEMSIQALEVQADTLRKALSTAERANEQLQEENRTAGERSRETSDKVYALMDSLRLNQVELKKQEAENVAKEKKITSLERSIQNLQAKISMEQDARVLAEQEKKEAEQESTLLKKKNKKIEEGVTASQQEQDKAEKEISAMNERVSAMQTQNAYLASRIDGQEEEKNSLRSEVKKVGDRTSELSGHNSQLRDEIDRLEEEVATLVSDKSNLTKELEYIKREDLDEAGRQRPVLIQSTESDLLDKLQINEFLFESQQARNPVPPLIEKIAQLLAMLHDGQQRADQYLNDLQKSNGLVSALRQRNMALFSRTQMFESFKTRALLRYVMNLVEDPAITDMHLDSISFGPREISEMINLFQRYNATDKIYVLSLQDNGLGEESISLILQMLFSLPYLRSLDLRKNCIGTDGIKRLEEQLRTMEGITSVNRSSSQVINVHSGNQLRLTVDVSEQMPKDMLAKEVDFTVHQELAHKEVDPFITSSAGQTKHPWSKSAAAENMRSTAPPIDESRKQEAVADPSAVNLPKPGVAPAVPQVGGPPVGLGGPGNVAALNQNQKNKNRKPDNQGKATAPSDGRVPEPTRRQSRRAKAAPPPALSTALDSYYQGSLSRPSSGRPLSSGANRSSSQAALDAHGKAAAYPMGGRSDSLPLLRAPGAKAPVRQPRR